MSRADEIVHAGAPPLDSLQATLIAAEALIAANKTTEAEQRLAKVADDLDPKTAPAAWGEYLRLRGALDAKNGSPADAYHAIAQSSTLLDLLGERYQAGLRPPGARSAHRAAGRAVERRAASGRSAQHLSTQLRRGARSSGHAGRRAASGQQSPRSSTSCRPATPTRPSSEESSTPPRCAELLDREIAAALCEAATADRTAVFIQLPNGDTRIRRSGRMRCRSARKLAVPCQAPEALDTRTPPTRAARSECRRSAVRRH